MTTKIPVELSSTPGIVDGSNATAITIDSSERVGIGITSPEGVLHVHGGDSGSSYTADGADKLIIEHSDSVAIDLRTPASNQALIMFSDGTRSQGLIGYNHSNDSLRFANSGNTERMRIDSSGNVGIGESSPAAPLHVEHSSATAYNGGAEITESLIVSNKAGTDNSGVNNVASIGLHVADGATSQGFINYVRTGNNTGNFTFTQRTGGSTYAEHMRLHSTGKLTVGATPTASNGVIEANASGNAFTLWLTATQQNYFGFESTETGGQAWSFRTAGSGNYGSANGDLLVINGSGGEFLRFDQSASTVNGDLNDTSDIGLKENITDTTDGLTKLLQLRARKFDWKGEDKRNNVNGFIAQEVETVLPDEVIGDDYNPEKPQHGHKAINTSGLLAVAVKAIQEQQEQIEQLKTEIQTLKGE